MSKHWKFKDKQMLKKGGQEMRQMKFTWEEDNRQEELLCNPPGPGCPDYEPEMPTLGAKTAGFGEIPNIVWYLVGAGLLYYVAKQQKWIK